MRLSDVNPLASAFWRMALAAPVLWVWALTTARGDRLCGRCIGFSPTVAWAGLYFALDMGLWHLSLHFTTVSNATLLSNFAPVFIALWMWCVYRIRFASTFLIGMAIALGGAVLLVVPNAGSIAGATTRHGSMGDALGLASAVFYAAYQLTIKKARIRYSTPRLMAWSTTITALVLFPFAYSAPGVFLPHEAIGWWPLLGLGLIGQIGGQGMIVYAAAHLPASLSSIGLLIQPLTATIAAWMIFGEALGAWQMVGGALLLWGITLSKRGSSAQNKTA